MQGRRGGDAPTLRKLRAIVSEVAAGALLGGDAVARVRLAAMPLTLRLRRRVSFGERRRIRTVRLSDGTVLTYRNEVGDLQTVVEIWLRRIYRPPIDVDIRTALDLGGHIGLVSVWLSRAYGCEAIVTVEPDPANVALLRRNIAANGTPAIVVEAAVGDHDGVAVFERGSRSNLGRVATGDAPERGLGIRLRAAASLAELLPPDRTIDLVKVDVEGSERAVLAGDLAWCRRVQNFVFEVHPGPDAAWITARLAPEGFVPLEMPGRTMVVWYRRDDSR